MLNVNDPFLKEENYMQRCLDLAALGRGYVAPNPLVGAVLVYKDRIIGEGYHRVYGGDHAEVNCINNVEDTDKPFIEKSTLYVSLEPCSHFGKTPPCASLIIENKIKKVVIGCFDTNKLVGGKGVQKLREAGIEVITGVLEPACRKLNERFFTFHEKRRPYIILKWAQSADGIIGSDTEDRLMLSNAYSNRLVHKWRKEEAAILVGTKTGLLDNPLLNVRLWKGHNPKRIVIDKELIIPPTHHIYNGEACTIIFNDVKNEERNNLIYVKVLNGDYISTILSSCFKMGVQSILVEGGADTLQSFIQQNSWDEARVISNRELTVGKGIKAPHLFNAHIIDTRKIINDEIGYYSRN